MFHLRCLQHSSVTNGTSLPFKICDFVAPLRVHSCVDMVFDNVCTTYDIFDPELVVHALKSCNQDVCVM